MLAITFKNGGRDYAESNFCFEHGLLSLGSVETFFILVAKYFFFAGVVKKPEDEVSLQWKIF